MCRDQVLAGDSYTAGSAHHSSSTDTRKHSYSPGSLQEVEELGQRACSLLWKTRPRASLRQAVKFPVNVNESERRLGFGGEDKGEGPTAVRRGKSSFISIFGTMDWPLAYKASNVPQSCVLSAAFYFLNLRQGFTKVPRPALNVRSFHSSLPKSLRLQACTIRYGRNQISIN